MNNLIPPSSVSPFYRLFPALIISIVAFLLFPVVGSMQSRGRTGQSDLVGFSITGNVQSDGANLAGAAVVLSGGASASTTTDPNGNYSFTGLTGGLNYTVTPYKSGYVFTPDNQTFANLQANQLANFLNGAPLCAPAALGLTAWYKGENNGSDSSSGGVTGSIDGNGTTRFAAGKVGQAFSFDGIDQRIAVPDAQSNSPASAITIDAWINPFRVNQQQVFVSKYNNLTSQDAFTLNSDATGSKLEFRVYQTGDSGGPYRIIQTTNGVLSVNVWTHIAGTFDTATQIMKIYVNGVDTPTTVIVSSGTLTSIFNSIEPIRLGDFINSAGNHVNFFQGLIDEAQIFDRELSQAEIQNIYASGSAGVCTQFNPTVLLSGDGNANDSSGNGDNGTIQGGVTYAAGKIGQAFSLNGTNGAIRINEAANNLNFGAGDLTIDTWVKFTETGRERFLFRNGYRGSSDNVRLSIFTDSRAELYVQDTAGNVADTFSANALNDGSWHHLVGVRSNKTVSLYVDGSLQNSQTNASLGSFNSSCGLDFVGAGGISANCTPNADNYFFGGLIDEFQVYKRALSPTEIQTQYSLGNAGIGHGSTFTISAGSLDTSFGMGGKVITPIGSGDDFANSVAIQSDGKIVAAGSRVKGTSSDFAVLRYNTDGSLDTAFGVGGKATTPIGTSGGSANSVVIQTDGKIIAIGSGVVGSAYNFALVRYNIDGSLDSSFGTGGKVTTAIGSSSSFAYFGIIQSDGKIVVAGHSANSVYDFALARYNTDGSLDSFFGTGGKVTTNINNSSNDDISSVGIQSDGKIIMTGYNYYGVGNTTKIEVARYTGNGLLDNSFGSGGIVTTSIGDRGDASTSSLIQPDNKIVVAGISYTGTGLNAHNDILLIRYNSDGSFDTSFGTSGKVIIQTAPPNGNYLYQQLNSIAIQQDGKIVGTGYLYNGSNEDFAAIRFNINGSLDTTFGKDGKVSTPVGSYDDFSTSVAIHPDGRIVAAGSSNNGSNYDFALVRYSANGTNVNVAPLSNLSVNFSNVSQPGYTVATYLGSSQLPVLPSIYALPANSPLFDIRTSAVYTGNVTVRFSVPNIADATACSKLLSLHFENGAWTPTTNTAPSYNSGTLVCTVTQTVTSLSPFAVVQNLAPTAAGVSVSGRVASSDGMGIRNARLTLTRTNGNVMQAVTGAFGYYRFDDIPAGETVIIGVSSKRYLFAQPTRVLTVNDAVDDVDFTAGP